MEQNYQLSCQKCTTWSEVISVAVVLAAHDDRHVGECKLISKG